MAFPLSAGNITMVLSVFRPLIAHFSPADKLLGGGFDFFNILNASLLISSASSMGRVLMASSTCAIMSSVGTTCGVTAKFPPLHKTDDSVSVSVRSVRLITVRDISSD